MSKARGKFLLIDGNSLVFRAFYALPPLQSSRGEYTNAVLGFTNMLFRLLEEEKPDYIAVAFDPPGPSFRAEIYREYKSQREKAPPELGEQMSRVKQILQAWPIPQFEIPGFEADDLIGTLTGLAEAEGLETVVVTGDGDLLQLVGDHTVVLLCRRGISQVERFDLKLLREKYGLEPEQLIDYKALKGDPSDNIPGVPGIGDKTARALLQKYGTLERLLEAGEEPGEKIAEKIREHREQLRMGRKLVTIRRDVPVSWDPEECRHRDPDYPRLLELFRELEFKALAARMKRLRGEDPALREREAGDLKVEQVNQEGWLALLDRLPEGGELVLLAEGEPKPSSWRLPPVLWALALDSERGYYFIPSLEKDGGRAARKALERLWESRVSIIGHHIKPLYHCLGKKGPHSPFVFDSRLAAYLLEPARGGYNPSLLLQEYLGLPDPGEEEKTLEGRGRRLAWCSRHLFALREHMERLLKEQQLDRLYYDLELPLAGLLARMEGEGIAVDAGLLKDYAAEIRSRLERLEAEIYSQAGEEFNLNSPRQLSRILFEKLKLPVVRRTKTGLSTDARVLEELAPHHEIVANILHYRQLVKLEGTYLSALLQQVDPKTGKVFTTLNQTVTATGRLSSSDPNLQNIPLHQEEGRRIRAAFIPSQPGQVLLSADYSQIELRILAHLSGDPTLVEAFRQEQDIHRRTAAEVFGVSLEEVTEEMRDRAKAVNFGIIYGISDFGLAQTLRVSRQEARRYIENYFARYPGVKEYIEREIALARERGFVTTLLNRRRYLPDLRSSNFARRSFAERMARNTPVQGSAADIIKLAMLRIDRLIRDGGFKARMLLQIHDELLFELPEEELNFFAPLVRREMEKAFELSVPLKAVVKWGRNWADLQAL